MDDVFEMGPVLIALIIPAVLTICASPSSAVAAMRIAPTVKCVWQAFVRCPRANSVSMILSVSSGSGVLTGFAFCPWTLERLAPTMAIAVEIDWSV